MKPHLSEFANTDKPMQTHIRTRMNTCVLNHLIPVKLNNVIAAVYNPNLIDVSLDKENNDKTSMSKCFSKAEP